MSSVNNNFVEPGAYVCPGNFAFGVTCFETPFSLSGHPLSYTIGPFLGYRWQLGASVVGVEADWSWKRGESTFAQTIPFVCFDARCLSYRSDAKTGSVTQNWDSSFRLRYGWLVTPSTLLYGTAGVAVADISGSFSYSGVTFTQNCLVGAALCLPPPGPGSSAVSAASWSDIRVGGTIGAGVETDIGSGWKVRAEYRFTDFGHYTKNLPVTTTCLGNGCSAPSNVATIDLKESFQTFRIGIGYDLP